MFYGVHINCHLILRNILARGVKVDILQVLLLPRGQFPYSYSSSLGHVLLQEIWILFLGEVGLITRIPRERDLKPVKDPTSYASCCSKVRALRSKLVFRCLFISVHLFNFLTFA